MQIFLPIHVLVVTIRTMRSVPDSAYASMFVFVYFVENFCKK